MEKVTFTPEVQTVQVPILGQSIINPNSLKTLRGTFAAMSMKAILLNNIWIDASLSTTVSRWVPFSHVMFCDPAIERMVAKGNRIAVGEAVSLMVSEWIYGKIMADVRQEWARARAEEYSGEKAAVTAREVREGVAAARLNRAYASDTKKWEEQLSESKRRVERERRERDADRLEADMRAKMTVRLPNRYSGADKRRRNLS